MSRSLTTRGLSRSQDGHWGGPPSAPALAAVVLLAAFGAAEATLWGVRVTIPDGSDGASLAAIGQPGDVAARAEVATPSVQPAAPPLAITPAPAMQADAPSTIDAPLAFGGGAAMRPALPSPPAASETRTPHATLLALLRTLAKPAPHAARPHAPFAAPVQVTANRDRQLARVEARPSALPVAPRIMPAPLPTAPRALAGLNGASMRHRP